MTITTIISLMLLIYVQRHRPISLDFGRMVSALWYTVFRRFFKFDYGYNRFVCVTFYYGIRFGVANIKQIVITCHRSYYF